MRSNPISLLACLLFFTLSSTAQNDPRYTIQLKNETIIPYKNVSSERIDQFNNAAKKTSGKSFAVIQFENIPSEKEKKQLQESGIELLEFISGNAYTVTINGTANASLLAQVKARAVFELSPQQKMQPELAKGNFPAWAVKVAGTIDVWVSFPKSFGYENVLEEIKKRNFDVISDGYTGYRIIGLRIAASRISELASLPFIEYVQAAPHEDQLLNLNSMALSKGNVLRGPLAAGGRNLKGEGVVVGVGDGGDVQSHIDVSGPRLINRNFLPSTTVDAGHGTHVTGTVAGAGLIQESYMGYAPKATIVSQASSNIVAYASTYVQDYGMVIANSSYGSIVQDCNYAGVYDLTSRILDQQAFDLPELQHVFAAGNDGVFTCPPYALGFKTVLGGYQSAKNVITVGSTFFRGDITINSSKGPVKDGRIKPEIAAQGQSVRSLWLNNTFSSFSGTSMSAPGVSGGLVLLEQRYRQLHSGANAQNGLLKALICNGGTDAGNEGPDYKHGFGNMNLLRSVTMIENNTYFIDSVVNAANKTHTISVPANTAQLKVTLYWQDPPASLLAAHTLVNDLDLDVTPPSGPGVLPRLLDTIPANVDLVAGTGVDHINNIEQVTIDNPATGTYTFKVSGTNITVNPRQKYYLVYDVIPESLVLTNPIGGEIFVPTTAIVEIDSTHIEWESYGGTASQFTLEFSPDNGTNWSLVSPVSNIVPADRRYFNWGVPDIQTNVARIRVTKNSTGATQTSLPFTILKQTIDSLTATQCEGYITLGWRPIAGATDYEVMKLEGSEFVHVAYTTTLNYTFTGLSKDSLYWVTVRGRINGSPGRRAMAVSRQPNSGTCAGAISDFDLRLDSIHVSSGREFTSTSLTATTPVTIRIKNLDDVISTDDIVVTYTINGGSTVTETINALSTPTSAINAGAFIDYTFLTPANLSAVGTYTIVATATKAADTVISNNSMTKTIKQLANAVITSGDLPWLDNFETTTTQSVVNKQMGLNGSDRYDFVNSSVYGRLQTFINSGIAYSGSKAITLDATRYLSSGSNTDSLTGTYNLSSFDTATHDMRLNFRYKNHGQQADAANKVWIRGSDAGNWIEAYDLFSNQNDPDGSFKKTSSIELSDILRSASPKQNFSSSFQIRWGQNGNGQATNNDGLYGYTFDDIELYQVSNDLQMISIDTPVVASCALSASNMIKITVRNSANSAITSVPVRFRIDGGTWLNPAETISSIPANDTVQYTFTATANLSVPGQHTIEALVDYGTDSYRDNDTVRVTVINSPIITVTSATPHLENFETGNGGWYSAGKNSSWEYGTPASTRINRAASGSKAWKTRLTGNYNDLEKSYLYSPCFDVSTLSTPTLSFSIAFDMEDCGGGLCDGAYMEYSIDGKVWDTLGAYGQGTNWYNKDFASGAEVWGTQNYTRWHAATIPLTTIPVPVAQMTQLRFRLVVQSDIGVNRDGVAIDDIHVYNNPYGIYTTTGASPVVNQAAVNGTSWIDFVETGTNKLIASINANSLTSNLGSTDVQCFINTAGVRNRNNQYYHDRNITIKPANVSLTDSAIVRFYFLDSETEALINATGCPACFKPTTGYDLGVSKYSDADDNAENGTVADDISGTWLFINSPKVKKVPFDRGYYAEFKVKNFSEFWLNNGGFDNLQALPVELLSFTAKRKNNSTDVLVEWKTATEFNVNRFEIEVAKGNSGYQQNQFVKIGTVNSNGNSTVEQTYTFTDLENAKSGVRYYRLKMIDNDGSFKYSAIRSVVFNDEIKWQINPNPSTGRFNLTYQAADGADVSVRVFDMNGKAVKVYKAIADGFVQKINIDLEETKFATGMYLVEISAGTARQSFRIIKQ